MCLLQTSGGSADYVEVEMLDPSVLPMAHSAKLEFQSLVQGVVTMLIERHRCWDMTSNASSVTSGKVQFLSVPANMVVLAAIKVALTFISPHFDRLAPHLVDWITVRCRLILWIWRECRAEVVRRAEERWQELWLKHRSRGPPPPRLKIRFTSMQRTDGHYVDLTAAKLYVQTAAVASLVSFKCLRCKFDSCLLKCVRTCFRASVMSKRTLFTDFCALEGRLFSEFYQEFWNL